MSKQKLTNEEAANIMIGYMLQLSKENPNDTDFGKAVRSLIATTLKMEAEYDAHDKAIKKLIDEN